MDNTRKKVVAVIQVRMGSTRLLQKVLLDISGKTAIEWIKYRLSFCKEIDKVVVSTSDSAENDPIEEITKDLDLEFYRGSEHDLVDRMYQTAKKFSADAIVRVTADCPLVDPSIVDGLVKKYRENPNDVDHVTNIFPPTYPDGMDVEVMPFRILEKLNQEVKDKLYREWLTITIMENPDNFDIINVPLDKNLSYLRLTVDYQEDLDLVTKIFEKIHKEGKVFGLNDILDLLRKEPELIEINKNRVDQGILNSIRSAEFHNLKKQNKK